MKTLNEITLYDLMAQDLDVWVTNNKEFGFDIQIDDESGESLVDDQGVHPFAVESFADFCRSYLATYDNAIKKEVA